MHTKDTLLFVRRLLATMAVLPWALLIQFECHAADAQVTPAQKDWNAVAALAKVAPAKRDPGPRLSASTSASLAQQHTDRARQASEAAKAFYEKYPNDPKVSEAKKVEAIMSIRGIRAADPDQRSKALGLAKSFRDNSAFSKGDRLSVAFEYEGALLAEKIRAKLVQANPAEWVKLADQLKLEFGDMPEVAARYVEYARTADAATANLAARKALQSSVADRSVKAEAQSIVDRGSLIGTQFSLRPTVGSSLDFNFQGPKSRPVLLVAWSPSDPDSLKSLVEFRRNITVWADVVYVQLGGSRVSRKIVEELPVEGRHVHIANGPGLKNALTDLRLRYAPIPYVYLVGADGVVLGHGRVVDIPVLLKVLEVVPAKK